jgi:hypothetical protein
LLGLFLLGADPAKLVRKKDRKIYRSERKKEIQVRKKVRYTGQKERKIYR